VRELQDRIPWLHRIREDAILLTSSEGLEALDTPSPGPTSASSAVASSISHELSVALSRIHSASLASRHSAKESGKERKREGVVVACSALKEQYRNLLRGEEAHLSLPGGRQVEEGKHLHKHIETYFIYR